MVLGLLLLLLGGWLALLLALGLRLLLLARLLLAGLVGLVGVLVPVLILGRHL